MTQIAEIASSGVLSLLLCALGRGLLALRLLCWPHGVQSIALAAHARPSRSRPLADDDWCHALELIAKPVHKRRSTAASIRHLDGPGEQREQILSHQACPDVRTTVRTGLFTNSPGCMPREPVSPTAATERNADTLDPVIRPVCRVKLLIRLGHLAGAAT